MVGPRSEARGVGLPVWGEEEEERKCMRSMGGGVMSSREKDENGWKDREETIEGLKNSTRVDRENEYVEDL